MDGTHNARLVHILHTGENGVIIGTDSQRLSGDASPNLSEGDIVVPQSLYDTVVAGLEEGIQYRFVHGDLVCDGENVEVLKRTVCSRLNEAFREVTTCVTVTHGETFTLKLADRDLSLLSIAAQCADTAALMSPEGELLLLSPDEVAAAAQRVLTVHNIARFARAGAFIRMEEAKTSKEVRAIEQHALQQMREESWT
tara:strand:+ start:46751 stop:47341 length:591 start_codon:yes stop_codon:yes gene_type:complete